MPLQPLTPSGVQNKQAELYALPDPSLYAEADSIRSDFRPWVKANFILDAGQVAYLDALPDDYVLAMGGDTSVAVRFRLPVTLVVLGAALLASKLIRTKPQYEYAFEPGSDMSATGSLTIEFQYS